MIYSCIYGSELPTETKGFLIFLVTSSMHNCKTKLEVNGNS